MKNTIKLIGAMRSIAIIALVAVIGFSMAACGDEEDTGANVLTVNNVRGEWSIRLVTYEDGGAALGSVVFEVTEQGDQGYGYGTLRFSYGSSVIGGWALGEDTNTRVVSLRLEFTSNIGYDPNINTNGSKYEAVLSNGGKTMTFTKYEGSGVDTFKLNKGNRG